MRPALSRRRSPRGQEEVAVLGGGSVARRTSPLGHDQAAPGSSLSEAQLCFLWEGQRLPTGCLVTQRGETLRVVFRGRPSTGPGPDFRDAVLATGVSELRRGDVEVHRRASGFRQHGHHQDPRYDGLILHLVWEDDEGQDTLLCCGRRAPVVALAPWLARRAENLGRWLSQPTLWQEPCLSAVRRLGAGETGRILDRLGDMRFRQKQEALRRALAAEERGSEVEGEEPGTRVDPEQVLWRALLTALGQREHAAAFAALAEALPVRKLRAATTGPASRETAATREGLLIDRFERLPVSLVGWGPRRPAADPRRRLAGAARLLARAGPDGLASYARRWLEEAERAGGPADVGAWMVGAGSGLAPLGLRAEALEAEGLGSSGRSLIGRGRALELATNAALPFLAALGQERGEPGLEARALALYRCLPEPEGYGATAFLERALRSPEGGRLARGVRRRQGLLYLFKRYCTQGGCGRCPLS